MSLIYRSLVVMVLGFAMYSNAEANPTSFNSTAKPSKMMSGVVVETMNASGYTYVSVKSPDGQILWAAGPKTSLSKGQTVTFNQGTIMKGFKSPTFNRTFKTIYFTTAFQVLGKPQSAQNTQKTNTETQVKPSNNKLPNIANGEYSVEQLFAQSNALSGKQVVFRGKVVKFNAGIMGKNWLHIQDGSGTAANKNHDITVTTDANVAVGDNVVVKGTMVTNKDFGAGYSYIVIIENADISKK